MNGEYSIPIPFTVKSKLEPYIGKYIEIGIRPQQVVSLKKPEREFYLGGKVFVHEILGDEGILSVSIGDTLFMVLTEPDMMYSLDEVVYLTWDTSVMNYFSIETGENLIKNQWDYFKVPYSVYKNLKKRLNNK